ncbi:hypothetical protein MTP99_015366 [Tenebrio molitor]|jgi:hypothetical protein|nr:hypothetical protein MTP99_015366 [Tenebrio molitor]
MITKVGTGEAALSEERQRRFSPLRHRISISNGRARAEAVVFGEDAIWKNVSVRLGRARRLIGIGDYKVKCSFTREIDKSKKLHYATRMLRVKLMNLRVSRNLI